MTATKTTTRTCKVCGKSFVVYKSELNRRAAQYCSNDCRGKAKSGPNNPNYKGKVERICQHCGKTFMVYPVRVKQGRAMYCSRECADAASKEARFEAECAHCGERLTLTYSRFNASEDHYCSQACYHTGRTKDTASSERTVEATCDVCGKPFWASKYDVQRGMGRFCSRDCYAVYKSQTASASPTRARGGKREDLGGLYVRSAWEANWARYLNWLQENGEVIAWEYEPETFEFKSIKKGNRFYTPDFRVRFADGHIEYQEVKGWMDAKSKTKLKRMAKYYPDIPIVLIDEPVYRSVAQTVRAFIPTWE